MNGDGGGYSEISEDFGMVGMVGVVSMVGDGGGGGVVQ